MGRFDENQALNHVSAAGNITPEPADMMLASHQDALVSKGSE